jgi:3-dehydroquinate dehydratase/shikimate dehydrogenase
VEHSLSPRLHNRGYRALDVPALYVPFHVERFGDFWLEVVEAGRLDEIGLPLRGLSVTAPHKEIALAVAGAASPRAQSIGGANTLVRTSHGASGPVWEAESTDPEGVLGPLAELELTLSGLATGIAIAIVGVGGAGRAVAAGLLEKKAKITLVNRGIEKGQKVADELDVPFLPLDGFDPSPFRVVVNATALGHHEDDPLPFDPARLAPDAVVVDMVYDRRRETPLARASREAGRTVVDGKEVLAAQAFEQFRLMTGHELPRELARRTVGLVADTPGGAP